jgi:hypothetical protein
VHASGVGLEALLGGACAHVRRMAGVISCGR